ncbi:MAG TPA: MFS transporter [Actinospica sp.]|jgi:MFS family permease|nr:MFS transporter [Actinospica sp.]
MTAVAEEAGPRASSVLRQRPFLLLWAGQALSGFGSSMTTVALPLALLTAGHAVAAVAAVGTVSVVVALTARIPAGLLADRHNQRRLLIICDLIRLAAIATVALYVAVRPLPLWLAFGAVAITAAASEAFKPAHFRLIRQIVDTEQMPKAVSLSQARSYAAQLIGPAVAGILVGTRPELPFAVDALTFLASAVCIAAIGPVTTQAEPMTNPDKPGFWNQLTAGLRYVVQDTFLRQATLLFGALSFLFAVYDAGLILGVGREHGGAVVVGWALSTAALAGLLGSLAAPRLQRWLSLPRLVAAGPAVAAVLLLIAALTDRTVAFAAGFSAMCLLVPAINASLVGVIASSTPEEIFGRVAAANDFAVQLLQPAAPLFAALLLAGAPLLSTTAAVLAAGFTLLALLALALRTPTRSES